MTAPGPMGYLAKPEAMGRLISRVFEDRLLEHGVPYARVGLMAVYVDDHATGKLVALKRCPADQALGVALGVMAKAWDQAMTVHGMFREAIDGCQGEVRMEIEELVDEHVTLVQERKKDEDTPPMVAPEVEAAQAQAEQDERMYAVLQASGADWMPLRGKGG